MFWAGNEGFGRRSRCSGSEILSSLSVRGKQGRPALCKEPIHVVKKFGMARIIVGEPMHPLKRKLLKERIVWRRDIGASQMDTIEDGYHVGVRPPVPVAAVHGGEPLHKALSNAG